MQPASAVHALVCTLLALISGSTPADPVGPVGPVGPPVTPAGPVRGDEPGRPKPSLDVLINEIDVDQSGIDTREFIELLTPVGGHDLSSLVVVLYNGAADGDTAYAAYGLGGWATGEDRLFVLGSEDVENVDMVAFTSNGLQNGSDAVALYEAAGLEDRDFLHTPAASPPAGARLVDALVYGTNDPPDAALIAALTPGASSADESAPRGATGIRELSLQRRPDGGAAFDPDRFLPSAPTPGRRNGPLRLLRIHQIQGASHRSPWVGAWIRDVEGVVTAVRSDRYHLQSLPGAEDDDPATSEALIVLMDVGNEESVAPDIGDHVLVTGWIEEHRPGGDRSNLPTTRLRESRTRTLLASGLELPAPIVLGREGRPLPHTITDDDTRLGSLDQGATAFDPENDGLDFFESLEGMRVSVRDALAVGATSIFGELAVVADGGQDASGLTAAGALLRSETDGNPERILLDNAITPVPLAGMGAQLDSPLTGVMDYSFGYPKLLLTSPVEVVAEGPPPEVAPAPQEERLLRVASLNVSNLSPRSDPRRVAELARSIVRGLHSPDLLVLQEVQDGSGPLDDGVVSSRASLLLLQGAIQTIGGPDYLPVEIPPVDGEDGGQPGGNIRVVFLYRHDRGLRLETNGAGGPSQAATVMTDAHGRTRVRPSPGRLAPDAPAWESTRKPLVAEFSWRGRSLFVVGVHLSSKLGDTSLFGSWQPPVQATRNRRLQQAGVVRGFVSELLRADPDALLMVLGDFNDFEWSSPLQRLQADGLLRNLTLDLPNAERFSYVFQGNAQTLDHILVSPAMAQLPHEYRLVHRHAGRLGAPTDHDVPLLSVDLPAIRPLPGPPAR